MFERRNSAVKESTGGISLALTHQHGTQDAYVKHSSQYHNPK